MRFSPILLLMSVTSSFVLQGNAMSSPSRPGEGVQGMWSAYFLGFVYFVWCLSSFLIHPAYWVMLC